MSWKVWKQPLERANEEFEKGYQKGLNLSDWNSAFSCFNSSYELYRNAGDDAKARVAWALAAFSRALLNPQVVDYWNSASASFLTSGMSEVNVTQTVQTAILANECQLKALEIQARNLTNSLERAAQLEEVAKKYLLLGNQSLVVPLLLEKQQVSGQARGHRIIAEAAKLRGDEALDSSPQSASEFYRMAAIHMKTAGDLRGFQFLSGKADDFSSGAKCYFCGREVHGRDVNFVRMKANITKFLEKQAAGQVMPSIVSANSVIACKGCYSAITIAADDIAKAYYDRVEAELAEFKSRMESELSHLRSRTGRLESKVR
jgi:hypothetical protein